MNKEKLKAINNILELKSDGKDLTNDETDVALKVLDALDGQPILRATGILNFCLKAIQLSKIHF